MPRIDIYPPRHLEAWRYGKLRAFTLGKHPIRGNAIRKLPIANSLPAG